MKSAASKVGFKLRDDPARRLAVLRFGPVVVIQLVFSSGVGAALHFAPCLKYSLSSGLKPAVP
jgi:hypothetical protein